MFQAMNRQPQATCVLRVFCKRLSKVGRPTCSVMRIKRITGWPNSIGSSQYHTGADQPQTIASASDT